MFAYRSILREPPRPAAVRESHRAAWLAVGVVCFGALPLGFGLTALFGDVVLPRAWTDSQRGFAGAALTCAVLGAPAFVPVTAQTVGSAQARPAFIVLAVVAATAAAIALAGRAPARGPAGRPREADPSGGFS